MKTIAVILAGLLGANTALAQGVIPAPLPAPAAKPVTVTVALDKPVGPYKPIYAWFGMDESNYGTTALGGKLLRELRDLSPVPVQIRAHHLLTSGNGTPELKWSSTNVYTEDAAGKPVYDFTILDGIFDAYKAAGVRPMVELGFMPKDLARDEGEYQIHYPGRTTSGTVQSAPKDYVKWRALVHAVVGHLVERYGRETVRQWYFEVWNEPDIDYWHATPEEYWKLYDYAADGVRAALPDGKVGGPASTGPANAKARTFLDGFLGHVTSGKSAVTGKRVPFDFISFHVKGQPVIVGDHVQMGVAKELADADAGFGTIAKYPTLRKLPIILSEADPEGCAACSAKTRPANNYRNGTLYPSYTAVAYKGLFELADRYKLNLVSMLSWSFEFEGKDYFEGFRTLATNGIDKPVLNFFRMAGMMTGTRVATESSGALALDDIKAGGVRGAADIDALATKGAHEAAVMVWNYHDDAEGGALTPASVAIQGLPKGLKRVLVTHYRIDDTHSNAYTVWKAIGSPQSPTPAQYAQLQAKDGLELESAPRWMDVDDRTVTLETRLPAHAISFVRLTW